MVTVEPEAAEKVEISMPKDCRKIQDGHLFLSMRVVDDLFHEPTT